MKSLKFAQIFLFIFLAYSCGNKSKEQENSNKSQKSVLQSTGSDENEPNTQNNSDTSNLIDGVFDIPEL